MIIGATGLINGNNGIVKRLGIGRRQIIGNTIGKRIEHITGHAIDVGRLGASATIAQDKVDLARIEHGVEPGHAANNNAVVRVILPSRESACDRIALVVKGEDIGHCAPVIFHIYHDGAVTRTTIHDILPSHDACRTHRAIGQNAHLERRVPREGKIDSIGIGNLFAVSIRGSTVGRVNQYGTLG